MDGAVRVVLPGGRWLDGSRVTEAWIRPIVGADEAFLLDELGRTPGPALATKMLARCVTKCGPEPADEQVLRSLTVGDREALLWHLRRVSIGDRLDATVDCRACGQKASVDISVADLLREPYRDWTPSFVESIAGHRVEFRLPVGEDQERLAASPTPGIEPAIEELVTACVKVVDGESASPEARRAISEELSQRLEALDPQAETLLETTCPACGTTVTALLDAVGFLSGEISRRSRHLFAEVHTLASVYHWSEREILAMTADRRRIYLDLIGAERNREWSA